MRKNIINVLAHSLCFAPNTGAGSAAENLSQEPSEAEKAEAAAKVVAETTKPTTAQKVWETGLVERVKVTTTEPVKMSNEELVAFGKKEAEAFKKIGEGIDKLETSSAERYAECALLFPVRNNVNGAPDLKRFADQIWGIIPEKYKTPSPTKAGQFLACTTAAAERNQTAKGIQAMVKYCQRNAAVLFAHLGVKPLDEDAKVLNKVANAVSTLHDATLIPEMHLLITDAEGNPIIDKETGTAVVLTFAQLLEKITREILKPELDEKKTAHDRMVAENKKHLAELDKKPAAEEVKAA